MTLVRTVQDIPAIGSAVALLSGGMDSTVLAYWLRAAVAKYHGGTVPSGALHFLSVNYGQRHKKELEYAARTAHRFSAPHHIVDLSTLRDLLAGSALTSDDVPVPHGHYTAESMKATVVANRNMIMLAVAAGYAVSRKLEVVAAAVHAGDHAIYPDCRPEFITSLRHSISVATEGFGEPELWAPFVHLSKAEIATFGDELDVPWAHTWSCYEGGARHCGKCGTCVERIEAFALAGVSDPTVYGA